MNFVLMHTLRAKRTLAKHTLRFEVSKTMKMHTLRFAAERWREGDDAGQQAHQWKLLKSGTKEGGYSKNDNNPRDFNQIGAKRMGYSKGDPKKFH